MAQDFEFSGVEDGPRDEWISMREAFRLPGQPCHASVWRWRTLGARRKNGTTVLLPTFQFNGRHYTTIAAYRWYVREQRK